MMHMMRYSRALSDVVESRDTVEVVLHNLELLQVAIGEVHEQMNYAINKFKANLSKEIKTLQSKWPSLRVNLQAELVDKVEEDNLVEFNHGKILTCQYTILRQKGSILAIKW